ncbi:MAG: ATP-binding cassette domain-containing protein, partial [Sulfitobacter litoralis]
MSDDIKIKIRNLYKIFGDDPKSALEHVKNGMGKTELLAEHNHVLGLNDINVDIPAGKTTVIMGLSGSGKSTLIRHLNRLIDPTSGEVLVDGEDILSYNDKQLRDLRQHRMSMVFQKFA